MITRFLLADRYVPRRGNLKYDQPILMASKVPALPPVDFPYFLVSNLEGRMLPLVNKGQTEVRLGCFPSGSAPADEDALLRGLLPQLWEASLKLQLGNAADATGAEAARSQAASYFKASGLTMIQAYLPRSWALTLARAGALSRKASERDPADHDLPEAVVLGEEEVLGMHGLMCWWGVLLVHLDLSPDSGDLAAFWAEPPLVGSFTRVGDTSAILVHNPGFGVALFRAAWETAP